MARGKAISVKIPTQRVIAGLEASLAKLEMDYATQEQKEAQYQVLYKAWQKDLADFAIANFTKAENIRTNFRHWNKNLNIDFDITVVEGQFQQSLKRISRQSISTLIVSRKRKCLTQFVSSR